MPKHRRKHKPAIFREVEEAREEDFDGRMRSEPNFVIDKKGDKENSTYKSPETRKRNYDSMKTRADRVLALNPTVPTITKKDPVKKKRHVTPEVAKALGKHLIANRKVKRARKAKQPKSLDVWGAEPVKLVPDKYKDVEDAIRPRDAKVLPERAKRSTVQIPNIILPQPGQSYRPTEEDHRDTMLEALAVANHRNEEEGNAEQILRRLEHSTDFYLRVDVDDPVPEPEEPTEDFKKKNSKYKTIKTRKLEKKAKLAASEDKLIARKVRYLQQFEKIDKIMDEVNETLFKKEKREELRKLEKEEKKKQTPYFGTMTKFQEDIVPVAFSDEIPTKLRQHKLIENPLYDRYKSIIRTGKAVPKSARSAGIFRASHTYIWRRDPDDVKMTQKEAVKITQSLNAKPKPKKHRRNKK